MTFLTDSWQLYGKSYATEVEEKLREHIYKSNLQYIKEFNAEGHSWTLGVNECASFLHANP